MAELILSVCGGQHTKRKTRKRKKINAKVVVGFDCQVQILIRASLFWLTTVALMHSHVLTAVLPHLKGCIV